MSFPQLSKFINTPLVIENITSQFYIIKPRKICSEIKGSNLNKSIYFSYVVYNKISET